MLQQTKQVRFSDVLQREQGDRSQKAMARKLGVTYSTYRSWIIPGGSSPSIDVSVEILRRLGYRVTIAKPYIGGVEEIVEKNDLH